MQQARSGSPIAVIGDLNVDLLLTVPALPGPGGDAIATAQRTLLGGSATNTAVVLARLGHSVRLAARTGADAQAVTARDALADEGIGSQQLTEDPGEPTSVNLVVVTPDGERTMYAYRGANARLAPDHLRSELLHGAAWLHLSGYTLLSDTGQATVTEAVRRARAAGVPVSLDVPVAPAELATPEIRKLLPQLDLLIVGEPEARTLTGQPDADAAAGELAGATAGRVAVKRGAAGSRLLAGGTMLADVPAMAVTVVDTTGAGDAFAAGLLHGALAGLDPEATLVLANTLGGLATTRPGAGQALPAARDVVTALRTGWSADPDLWAAAGSAAMTLPPDDPEGPRR